MSNKQPLKILINGWYGQRNAGDDAILDVFVARSAAHFDAHVTVLSEFPENVEQSPGVRSLFHPVLVGRGCLAHYLKGIAWRHLRAIREADLVVLGGGGILRDNTNWRNLFRLLDEIWLAKLFGRKTMMYAIGVGPFKTRFGKWLIGATARACDLVTVRDERAATLLREIGVPAEHIHVVADPAFLMASEAPPEARRSELETLFKTGKKKLGFYPTFYLRRLPESIPAIAAALDQLAEEEDLEFVAVPMSVLGGNMDDVVIARRVQAAMKRPEVLHIYEHELTARQLKWVTTLAPLNLTVRLHAMIFSLGCEVPVVAVNYEHKVKNVFEDFASPDYLVDIDANLTARLVEATRKALRSLEDYGRHIGQQRPRVAVRSNATFELMQALMEKGSHAQAAIAAPESKRETP
jgi:polysaccharide pyruvyl transferase CsaB